MRFPLVLFQLQTLWQITIKMKIVSDTGKKDKHMFEINLLWALVSSKILSMYSFINKLNHDVSLQAKQLQTFNRNNPMKSFLSLQNFLPICFTLKAFMSTALPSQVKGFAFFIPLVSTHINYEGRFHLQSRPIVCSVQRKVRIIGWSLRSQLQKLTEMSPATPK